jgi:tetratricopeptide (TPR) repeat protein
MVEDSATEDLTWTARARRLYERAVFGGESGAIDVAMRELDVVEAELALARGRILHARFLEDRVRTDEELALFERAAALYGALGDGACQADALFWVGTFHQVVEKDDAAAVPVLQRAYALASDADDRLTLSYIARHLGFADWAAGRADDARARLEESLRLRREINFLPGVAAALVALAEFSAEHDQPEESRRLLDEARRIAESSDSHGVLRWIETLENPS